MSNLSNINNNFIVDDDGKILIGLTLASGASILQVTGDSKFVGIVDVTNFKINGAQGTDGQLLTSTGSGIGWEDNIGGSVFLGATSTDDGTSGAVPQPLAADYLKFLRGDATWATVSLPNDFIPSTAGAVGTAGLVPAPAAATQGGTFFLNGDGSFSVPPYPAQANDFLTALTFDTSDGVITATVQNQSDVTVDLDGRYVVGSGSLSDYLPLSGGSLTGDLQVTNEITVNKTNVNTPGKITINGNTDATLQLKSEDTALAANETLGVIEFYGSDATTPGAGVKSSIRARNGDQVGGTGNKSNLIFAVSPGNSSNNTEAMRINPTGSIAIDGATKYGTSGQVLTSAGDAPPTWEDAAAGGVTSVAALTLGTTGTDLSSTVAGGSGDAVITLQVPSASAANRGALTAADWTTFNSKTSNTGTVTGTGTQFTLPVWSNATASTAIGNSMVSQNAATGTTLTIASVTPTLAINDTTTDKGDLKISRSLDATTYMSAGITDSASKTYGTHVFSQTDGTTSRSILTLQADRKAVFDSNVQATGIGIGIAPSSSVLKILTTARQMTFGGDSLTVLTDDASSSAGFNLYATNLTVQNGDLAGRRQLRLYDNTDASEDSTVSLSSTDSGSVNKSAAITFIRTGETLRLGVSTSGAAVPTLNTSFIIQNTGKIQGAAYGSGTFTGTEAYNLAVDSSGNIIETPSGGGGGGGGTAKGGTFSKLFTSVAGGSIAFLINRDTTGTMVFDVMMTSDTSTTCSIAKKFTVVKQFGVAPVVYKILDTGPDLTVDFTPVFAQHTNNTNLKCTITPNNLDTQKIGITIDLGFGQNDAEVVMNA